MPNEHVLDEPIRDEAMHGRSVRDISCKACNVFTPGRLCQMSHLLVKIHAGNDNILEIAAGVSIYETVKLEFLRDFDVSTVEGEFCPHRPDAIE